MLFLILFSFISQAQVTTMVDCKKSAECIKLEAVCGRKASVNQKFQKQWIKKVKEDQMVTSCLAPTSEDLKKDEEAKPICLKGKCQLSE